MKKLVIFLSILITLLSSFIPVNAVDINTLVSAGRSWKVTRGFCRYGNNVNIPAESGGNTCRQVFNSGTWTNSRTITSMTFGPIDIVSGNFYVANLRLGRDLQVGDKGSTAINWTQSTSGNFDLISWKQVGSQNNFPLNDTTHAYVYNFEIILKAKTSANNWNFEIGNSRDSIFWIPGDAGFGADYRVSEITEYVPTNNNAQVNKMDEVKNQISTLNQTQNQTNNKLDEVNRNISRQTQTQEQQHNQQKQEEQQRENQGNEQSQQAQGMFNFTAFNPFSGIFALFNNGGACKPIPIISGMLKSKDKTYCPWFSANVRNTLTPVIGISSMMLLFGFLISWLKKGNI